MSDNSARGTDYHPNSLFSTGNTHAPRPSDDDIEFVDVQSLTIGEFVGIAKALTESLDSNEKFCKFVLNGKLNGQQYQVDPIRNALEARDMVIASRDYDSMLGIGHDIYVNADLTLYPVSKIEETLTRNVHIHRSFSNNHGNFQRVPLHHIPNISIAKWGGDHNMLRVFIPGLYTKERNKSWLSQDEYATFYEKGLRPAITRISAVTSEEWPPTYQGELFRARGKTGRFAFQTKTLGHWLVGSLADALRQSFYSHDVSWGERIFFLYQVRGVKASNVHQPYSYAASAALDDLFLQNRITEEGRQACTWWIDVGLELSAGDGHCLSWRTDSHYHIVKTALSIPSTNASRITSPGSSKYVRDLTSHLTAVSGCRISPGVRAQGPYKAAYLQLYTTDKSITYRPEGSHFGKFVTGKEVLTGKFHDYCRGLYNLYRDASNINHGHARVEVRVPLEYAADVLVNDDHSLLRVITTSLIKVPSVEWWSLKAYRVHACLLILEQQEAGTSVNRRMNSAILLTAATPWFLNGVHSTPDNGSCSRDLMRNILPLISRANADPNTLVYPLSTRSRPLRMEEEEQEDDEEEGEPAPPIHDDVEAESDASEELAPNPPTASGHQEMVPHAPYGLIFLRDIRIGERVTMPRFYRAEGAISSKTFKFIFGMNEEDLEDFIHKGKYTLAPNPGRVINKMKPTALRIAPPDEVPIFDFSSRGFALPPPPRDDGSDIEDDPPEAPVPIDAAITNLWHQFIRDLTATVPNRKLVQDPSYCILTKAERAHVDESTHRNLRLADYFNQCQYRQATKAEWNAAFNKFWPPEPYVRSKSQNWGNMKYYNKWADLISSLADSGGSADTLRVIRGGLQERFNRLFWVPNVQGDRVWYTKQDSHFSYLVGNGGPAPRILIKWDKRAIV